MRAGNRRGKSEQSLLSGEGVQQMHETGPGTLNYTLVRPRDGAWGIPTEAGDWNGMIGMVKRNEADLALGPFGLTYSRSRVVDFSSPILIDYYRILTKRPRSEPDPKGFLTPFRWHVWIGLVLSVGVIGVVLFGVRKAAHTFFGGEEMNPSKNASLPQHLWAVYGALISQPYTWMSRSWSGRVVVGMWWLTALIIARSYSSALTSMLAVRTVPVKYNYLRQVIGDPDIHLIFEKATALVEHMSTVQEGVYKDLANTIQQDRAHFLASSKLYDAAYTDVRNRQYALLVEDTTCRKVFSDDFTKYGRCDFYIGKERYWPLIFCLIGRKGTPIMQAINSKIERLVSHDLYFKWLEDELPNATACLKASTKITVNEAYDLTGLWGVFVLFLGGLIVAALILMTEVCVAVVAD
ncbi:glutamate receptor-like [Penaeus chinensis]|uniref:glutamate receptor-like n=1 Tax=Penaeus chinensis TaxID=139456 RepID=UPI001FB7744E|nr:glutamate receptor-like [Penaeus chinensis]